MEMRLYCHARLRATFYTSAAVFLMVEILHLFALNGIAESMYVVSETGLSNLDGYTGLLDVGEMPTAYAEACLFHICATVLATSVLLFGISRRCMRIYVACSESPGLR